MGSKVLDAEDCTLSDFGRLVFEALVEERKEVVWLQIGVEVGSPLQVEGSLRRVQVVVPC